MKQKQWEFIKCLLEESSVLKAAQKAGISKNTAYNYLKQQEFTEELKKAKLECLSGTIRYLQGGLALCSEKLMEIVKNPATADQVRINAINAVFQNCKGLIDTCEIEERMQKIEELLEERKD